MSADRFTTVKYSDKDSCRNAVCGSECCALPQCGVVRADDRFWRLPAVGEIYHAATVGSAQAFGLSNAGLLAPGYKADIVFVDLGAINWTPHNWTVNQLVHVEDATSVRHVMIGGTFVVREARLLTLDMAKLAREAEAARDRLENLNVEWRDLFVRLEPVISSFCPSLAAHLTKSIALSATRFASDSYELVPNSRYQRLRR
jgi:hypothetical protein